MAERVERRPTQPAYKNLAVDRKPAEAIVTRQESRILPKHTVAFISLLLITLAAVGACKQEEASPQTPTTPIATAEISPTPDPTAVQENFGFTIPDVEKVSWDRVLDYARRQQDAKGSELVRTDRIILSIYPGGSTDQPHSDISALVLAETGDEYNDIQREWTENLQALFSPLSICDVRIGWATTGVTLEQLGLDPWRAIQTPDCEGVQ